MTELSGITQSIGELIKTLFGYDYLAISLFVIILFVVVIVFTGLDLTIGLMIMIPLIVFLTAYAGFPSWILFILVIGMGIVYYFAVKQALNR